MTLLTSFTAKADLGQLHYDQMCKSDEAKGLMGNTGTCNILTMPSKQILKGVCSGSLAGKIPCRIEYDTTGAATTVGMHVTCGEDMTHPMLAQKFGIQSSIYSVSRLLKTSEGKNVVTNDPSLYGSIISSAVQMLVIQMKDLPPTAEIIFMLQEDNMLQMQDVTCEAQR
jgi:hypothetical protein